MVNLKQSQDFQVETSCRQLAMWSAQRMNSLREPTFSIIPNMIIKTHMKGREFGTCLVSMVEFKVQFNLGSGILKVDYKIEGENNFQSLNCHIKIRV
jgi:hypothetical protein